MLAKVERTRDHTTYTRLRCLEPDSDLYLLIDEQFLDGPPVALGEPRVVHPDAKGQCEPQVLGRNSIDTILVDFLA